MLKKIISFVLSFTLIASQPVFAQGVAQINLGNYLRTVGSSMAMDKFRPLHMRYFSYDALSDNFQLLLDKGDNKDIKEAELEEKTKVLMDYFKIGLSLPNEKFWVNLRPDAQDQIIDPELEKTDMGRIMLEADLQLKKDTAGLTSPQNPEGKLYWEKLYKKAGELFGTENITIPTITRPWIVPGEIILRQGEDSAYIFKANMKVMLEQDHLKNSAAYNFTDPRMKELNEYSSQLIRELIIPKLTKEVNTSKRYAALRQVFFSLVMARWFKDTFGSSGSTSAPGIRAPDSSYVKLINSGDLTNLTSQESWSKTYYFNEYKKSFEKGEYNLKEDIYTPTGQVIRSYVSGGIVGSPIEMNMDGYKFPLFASQMDPEIVAKICKALGIKDDNVEWRKKVTEIVMVYRGKSKPDPEVEDVANILGLAFQNNKGRSGSVKEIAQEWIKKRPEEFIKDLIKQYPLVYFRFSVKDFDFDGNMSIKLEPAGTLYEPWNAGKVNSGSGQIGGYVVKDEMDSLSSENNEERRKKLEWNMWVRVDDIKKILAEALDSIDIKDDFLNIREDVNSILTYLNTFNNMDARIEGKYINEIVGFLHRKGRSSGKFLVDILPEGYKLDLGSRLVTLSDSVSELRRFQEDWEKLEIDVEAVIKRIVRQTGVASKEYVEDIVKEFRAKIGRNPTVKEVGEVIGNALNGSKGIKGSMPEAVIKKLLELKQTVSSAMQSSKIPGNTGGIDFRQMNYLVQPMGSFKDLRFGLPTLSSSVLERIDLDKELESLRDMVKNGMVPSGMRVKEYLAACFQKGKIEEKQDDLLVCLAEIYRLAEEENLETSPELRESLVIVDTGKFVLLPNNQRVGLN